MTTTRWSLMVATAALLLGACSSDDGSSAESTAGEASVTAAVDSTVAVETTAAPETTEGSVPEATDSTTATTDDDPLVAAIDDTPVCVSFSRVIVTSILTGFVGSGTGGEPNGVERVEVVAYSSLAEDAATLRSAVPAELQPGLEPLLLRIDASPVALAAGGFTADEIVTIASAWNTVLDAVSAGTPLDAVPDAAGELDQGQLDAATAAFVAAVGTFADYSSADDASDLEDEGAAWLDATCPLLAESMNGS